MSAVVQNLKRYLWISYYDELKTYTKGADPRKINSELFTIICVELSECLLGSVSFYADEAS